jgi:hypothetical protein
MIERNHGAGKLLAGGQTFEAGWKWSWETAKILENSIPYLMATQPWAPSVSWTLAPGGDGPRTVFGQFRNGAGVWSGVTNGTIILDTAAPSASTGCVATTSQRSFPVSWVGSDATSGIAVYDVQYRVGPGGTWVTWFDDTTTTSATFGPSSPVTVEYNQTYYFRARALDNAGNLGAYAPVGGCATLVELHYLYLPLMLRHYSTMGYAAPCSEANSWCENYDGWETSYGPLEPGAAYQAYPDDATDYYFFDVPSTSDVTVVVQNYQATGQLILYRHREGDAPEFVANWGAGGTTMTIGPLSLTTGKYYVRVETSATNPSALYTLTVTAN